MTLQMQHGQIISRSSAKTKRFVKNRRILYNVTIAAGFTNLPSEWWHYDYGDKFWAYFKRCKAKYKGIIDIEFPDRWPLS